MPHANCKHCFLTALPNAPAQTPNLRPGALTLTWRPLASSSGAKSPKTTGRPLPNLGMTADDSSIPCRNLLAAPSYANLQPRPRFRPDGASCRDFWVLGFSSCCCCRRGTRSTTKIHPQGSCCGPIVWDRGERLSLALSIRMSRTKAGINEHQHGLRGPALANRHCTLQCRYCWPEPTFCNQVPEPRSFL